ncbi:Uncharacterized protein TCM_025491 [Theobroma cacao]|uniref:Bet v I/Major latex protein domain-containing protein n=1 Tax=Theobroma cacao TaxID=3641 RepID=A0A061EZM3_THECC|nr:Uncharacterized protein TCM_025491 [Theobroma cacao]
MHRHLSQDTLVAVPATVVWDVYCGLKLGRLVDKLLRDVVGTVKVIEGNGGVGTLIRLTFPPGTGYKKFTKIDDENRVKETEVIEGGSSIEYEVDDKLAEIASHMYCDDFLMLCVTKYVLSSKYVIVRVAFEWTLSRKRTSTVGFEAAIVWDVYRSLDLEMHADELRGDVVGKVEFVEGDGGVGSIVKVTFPLDKHVNLR